MRERESASQGLKVSSRKELDRWDGSQGGYDTGGFTYCCPQFSCKVPCKVPCTVAVKNRVAASRPHFSVLFHENPLSPARRRWWSPCHSQQHVVPHSTACRTRASHSDPQSSVNTRPLCFAVLLAPNVNGSSRQPSPVVQVGRDAPALPLAPPPRCGCLVAEAVPASASCRCTAVRASQASRLTSVLPPCLPVGAPRETLAMLRELLNQLRSPSLSACLLGPALRSPARSLQKLQEHSDRSTPRKDLPSPAIKTPPSTARRSAPARRP